MIPKECFARLGRVARSPRSRGAMTSGLIPAAGAKTFVWKPVDIRFLERSKRVHRHYYLHCPDVAGLRRCPSATADGHDHAASKHDKWPKVVAASGVYAFRPIKETAGPLNMIVEHFTVSGKVTDGQFTLMAVPTGVTGDQLMKEGDPAPGDVKAPGLPLWLTARGAVILTYELAANGARN